MDKLKQDGLQIYRSGHHNPLDQQFWDAKWASNQLGWDIGFASPPITDYMACYPDKNVPVLIPGCGNAYEAEYLVEQGFSDITLLDISPTAVKLLKERFIRSPQVSVLCGDFFQYQGEYDLIIEQTFFCALPPHRRADYAQKTYELLKEDGEIVGVLFDRSFEKQGPPFGGDVEEYCSIFNAHFVIRKMEECYNSIPERVGSEVFIRLEKRSGTLKAFDTKACQGKDELREK